MSSDANYAASQTDADRHKDDDQCFRKNTTLTATVHSLTPGFYPRDPASSADCFRRLLKTYLFARYQCIQRISGSQRLRALYKSTHSLTHSQSLTVERLQKTVGLTGGIRNICCNILERSNTKAPQKKNNSVCSLLRRLST